MANTLANIAIIIKRNNMVATLTSSYEMTASLLARNRVRYDNV